MSSRAPRRHNSMLSSAGSGLPSERVIEMLPPPVAPPSQAELTTVASRLEALERRLMEQMTSLAAQAHAAQLAAEAARDQAQAVPVGNLDGSDRLVQRLRDELDSQQASLRVALDQRLAALEATTAAKIADLEDRLLRWGAAGEGDAPTIDVGSEERVERLRQDVDEHVAARLLQAEQATQIRLGELERSTTARLAEVEHLVQHRVADAQTGSDERFDEVDRLVQARLAELEQSTLARIAQVDDETRVRLGELEALAISRAADTDRALVGRLDGLESRMTGQLAEVQAQVQAEVQDRLRIADQQSADRAAELERLSTERLAEAERLGDARIAEIEHRVTTRLTEADERAQARLHEAQGQVDARMGESETRIGILEQHVDRVVESAEQFLVGAINDMTADIEARHAQVVASLTDLEGRVGAHVEGRLAAVSGEVDQRLTEVTDRVRTDVEAANERVFTMEQRQLGVESKVQMLAQRVADIDVEALDQLREKVQSLAGETVLVRIEMDRLTGSIDERFDRLTLRVADVESRLNQDEDISLAVQDARVAKLERDLLELDPDRFATKEELARIAGALPNSPMPPPPTHLHAVGD